MIIIGSLFVVACASVAFVMKELAHAPEGYEDEAGFHLVDRTNSSPSMAAKETHQTPARWAA